MHFSLPRIVAAAALLIFPLAGCVVPDRAASDVDPYLRIGRCEQPGHGWEGIAWNTHGRTYSGGLGFYNGTWTEFRESWMPANAGDATPVEQLLVAQKLHARYGWKPWGCAPKVGLR